MQGSSKHQGPTVITSNCSAFVPSTGVTIRGALTICNGSRSVTELIVLNEAANGKRAIATWASPFGTPPIHTALLVVRNIVPGFQVLVGHHESAGKSILENSCPPCELNRSNCTRKGGSWGVFTFQ